MTEYRIVSNGKFYRVERWDIYLDKWDDCNVEYNTIKWARHWRKMLERADRELEGRADEWKVVE